MVEAAREKLLEIRDTLLDPFSPDGLEEKFMELYGILSSMDAPQLRDVLPLYEEIRLLLYRNLEIISGSLKPIVERYSDSLFSRRV